MKFLKCFIDGFCLCVVRDDFINLQESDAVFIKPSIAELEEINKIEKDVAQPIHDEALLVADNMIKWGGSFVEEIGKALLKADPINRQKIKEKWPEYWKKYSKAGGK